MQMKRYGKIIAVILAIFLVVVVLGTVIGYRFHKDPAGPSEPELLDPTIKKTTLIVEGATAKVGDKRVEVTIKVAKNPGILGIDFNLFYDDSVMALVDAKSQLDLKGCVYTPPAYFRNPTTFLWDFQDANWVKDGAFLKLYFDVLDTAPAGDHEIKIMYSYGNIFDADFEPIDVAVRNGYLSVD